MDTFNVQKVCEIETEFDTVTNLEIVESKIPLYSCSFLVISGEKMGKEVTEVHEISIV